jgi:hypothetical protein
LKDLLTAGLALDTEYAGKDVYEFGTYSLDSDECFHAESIDLLINLHVADPRTESGSKRRKTAAPILVNHAQGASSLVFHHVAAGQGVDNFGEVAAKGTCQDVNIIPECGALMDPEEQQPILLELNDKS